MLHLLAYSAPGSRCFSRLLVESLCQAIAQRQPVRLTLTEQPADLMAEADLVLLCAASDQLMRAPAGLVAQLRQLRKQQPLLALGAAVAWCAEAELAPQQPLCAHWHLIDSLRMRFPNQRFCTHLYSCEGRVMSAAGELATLDALLHWLSERAGGAVAQQLADHWLMDKVRLGSERQRSPLAAHLGIEEPKLLEAVALMEANVEEPLATSEIADYLAISRRQLERLFKKHLQQVPSRYYLNLRLDVAQKMLLETPLSIVDIGARCGFSSGPHFSTAYRQRFDWTPREARSRHLKKMKEAASD